MHLLKIKNLFFLFTSLFLFVLIPGTIISQTEFPNTPAGNRAKEVFELFSGKNQLAPKEYVRQNCTEGFKQGIPEAQWGGVIVQIRNMIKSVELASIEKSEPYEISYTIRSASSGPAFSISVSVEQEAPNKISMMRFMPAGQGGGAPGQQPAKNITTGKKGIEGVKEYLNEQEKKGIFSGSALIAKDGKQLLIKSAGLASKRFKAPNNKDTKFNLGSINKSFTAVAILQLVEAGKIGMDDPINKYLDYFPEDIGSKVTIKQLLLMNSGWGDYWGNEYYLQHKDELRTVPEYMEFIKNMPLDFEPGSRMQHSNTGYEVAGAIIEKVSGMDYFDYIREKIYKPAGMLNSDSYDRDSPVENLATGYTNNNNIDTVNTGWLWENTYILSPKGTPAGGGYSTVEDMLNYDNALRNGKLIGADYFDYMCNRYSGKIGDPFIQKGVARSAGGAPGVSSFYARDRVNGYTIFVLTNVDNPVAIDIGNEIIKILGLE